ncbi:RagB/SusD family nutrient uptake outer membrane protein [Carboxylicivirga linearis]|uniref:RagB/SusD family nutrient uptake outer membrane protein n=1 Tax=Carboxylicivirga linearis TaxID=1628157 RepID=A0ABS5JUD9_9BACT|nr:RagB/SusD family nutrient uptake outer membrane protein [Carboxylicivirga linearis]MBS2098086.1 RagB/SusD family nutrient uptake outer membrane protein [Carboxylicivirga linearis]
MKKNSPIIVLFLAFIALFSACNDILEVEDMDVLKDSEHYKTIADANSAVFGAYALFQELSPQLVVLNELRADLMDITFNADHFLEDVSKHTTALDNPWTDPRPFYKVINNCNDVMKNLTIMYEGSKITREQYYQRYSDMGALRTYVYLQLIIHYGSVPYITEPVETIDDLLNIGNSDIPVLGIEDMLAELLQFMEELPYKLPYSDTGMTTGFDGFSFNLAFIDKEYLLGELNLWNGNYLASASYFKNIMERSTGNMDRYKIPTDFFTGNNYHSRYARYFENDLESAMNNWPTMFSTYGTSDFDNEWIWLMYFHKQYEPSPFYELFSIDYGEYYLKPSAAAIKNWNSQTQLNGFIGDFRGNIEDEAGNTGSYMMVGNNPVITKYTSDHEENNPLQKPGKWFKWRASSLHLRYSEAANRDGKHTVAYALINNGIQANYAFEGNKDTIYGQFNYEMTHLPFPYDFDARTTNNLQTPPVHRGLWYRNVGLRNRVSLQNFTVAEPTDSLLTIEDKILEENALEMAFEGDRWGDLVRIALRRGDNTILAEKIARKFELAGDAATANRLRTYLSDRSNWWLPLKDEEE